jgi:multiple antibiotic resistance protein
MLPADAAASFLLAFPALFSIINPVTGAFIFREATAERTHRERLRLARLVGIYSLIVLSVALWAGSYVLAFLGISIAALRISGGIILAMFAWNLLAAPEQREKRKQEQAAPAEGVEDVAFYPLTLPFTTGPGTISVAVALGAGHPPGGESVLAFFVGVSGAAVANALLIWIAYSFADRLSLLLGVNGSRVVTRVSAFLLFCIGAQILINGVTEVLGPLLARR